MRNKKTKIRGLRKQIIISCLISAGITALIEIFLLINISMVNDFLKRNNQGNLFAAGSYSQFFFVCIFVLIGLFSFLICLFLMENKTVRYILELSKTMSQVSQGDLQAQIEVKGDNELSAMASELNQLTVSMRRLIDRERESEQTKNELITNVAHDLRTPLTSINGYLQLMATPGVCTPKQQEKYLAIVQNKAKRLEYLIENLFDFTKLSYEKYKMKVETLDIVKLLEQLLEEFYPSFEAKGMVYELISSQPTVFLNADGNLLARVFDNLINNAIKYGAEGKRVEVKVKKEEAVVTIRVLNYGRVIPPEKLPHVFDKLYRVEESREQKVEGNGLGLAIAKNIVEMHGGSIGVKSDLEGTVFTVQLKTKLDISKENFERID